jgi:hypothetical protein
VNTNNNLFVAVSVSGGSGNTKANAHVHNRWKTYDDTEVTRTLYSYVPFPSLLRSPPTLRYDSIIPPPTSALTHASTCTADYHCHCTAILTLKLTPSHIPGGHSAGGHLAALVSLDEQYLREVGLTTSVIRGVIGISGVYNLSRMLKRYAFVCTCFCLTISKFRRHLLAAHYYLLPAFGDDPNVHIAASPITHVKPTHVRYLLLNAKYDFWLAEDSEELKHELEQRGVIVETIRLPTYNHRFLSYFCYVLVRKLMCSVHPPASVHRCACPCSCM